MLCRLVRNAALVARLKYQWIGTPLDPVDGDQKGGDVREAFELVSMVLSADATIAESVAVEDGDYVHPARINSVPQYGVNALLLVLRVP